MRYRMRYRLRYRLRRQDGAYGWVLDRGQVLGDGEILQGVIMDDDAYKTVETAMHDAEAKFRYLFHANPDVIMISTLADVGAILRI